MGDSSSMSSVSTLTSDKSEKESEQDSGNILLIVGVIVLAAIIGGIIYFISVMNTGDGADSKPDSGGSGGGSGGGGGGNYAPRENTTLATKRPDKRERTKYCIFSENSSAHFLTTKMIYCGIIIYTVSSVDDADHDEKIKPFADLRRKLRNELYLTYQLKGDPKLTGASIGEKLGTMTAKSCKQYNMNGTALYFNEVNKDNPSYYFTNLVIDFMKTSVEKENLKTLTWIQVYPYWEKDFNLDTISWQQSGILIIRSDQFLGNYEGEQCQVGEQTGNSTGDNLRKQVEAAFKGKINDHLPYVQYTIQHEGHPLNTTAYTRLLGAVYMECEKDTLAFPLEFKDCYILFHTLSNNEHLVDSRIVFFLYDYYFQGSYPCGEKMYAYLDEHQ